MSGLGCKVCFKLDLVGKIFELLNLDTRFDPNRQKKTDFSMNFFVSCLDINGSWLPMDEISELLWKLFCLHYVIVSTLEVKLLPSKTIPLRP